MIDLAPVDPAEGAAEVDLLAAGQGQRRLDDPGLDDQADTTKLSASNRKPRIIAMPKKPPPSPRSPVSTLNVRSGSAADDQLPMHLDDRRADQEHERDQDQRTAGSP